MVDLKRLLVPTVTGALGAKLSLMAQQKEKEDIALKEKLDKREVAKTMMEKDTHMAILEIIKEYGISLREGSQGVKAYYEIAKTAYQEGFMAGLHKIN